MSVFFTSDLHFSHEKIIQYCSRPWASRDEMDLGLVERWNSTVGEGDDVYILGDMFFCGPERAHAILDALHGRKHLVLGNHDHRIRKNKELQQRFTSVLPDLCTMKIDDQLVIMCHFPLLSWENQRYGSFMLHGHTHGALKFDGDVRRLDVGTDVHDYRPVSWTRVRELLCSIPAKETV